MFVKEDITAVAVAAVEVAVFISGSPTSNRNSVHSSTSEAATRSQGTALPRAAIGRS